MSRQAKTQGIASCEQLDGGRCRTMGNGGRHPSPYLTATFSFNQRTRNFNVMASEPKLKRIDFILRGGCKE